MKRYILFIFICTFYTVLSSGQNKEEKQSPREIFLEAESYLLYEEYEEALPLYLKLLKDDPTNNNLNYKVGLCYLNLPYAKDKSIAYLEKAAQDINEYYKTNNFKERQAPLDALFYLGTAYRINDQLDKAMKAYQEFKKRLDPDIYDEELVIEQIETVERARRYFSKPIYYVAKNVGEPISSRYAEKNAVVSGDETVLAFNRKLPFYEALFVSVKVDGKWQNPVNIIPELGVDGDVAPTGLSFNGKEMIIYRNDNYDGNLYVSRYINGRWTPIKRLNDRINTRFWESHGSLSPDGYTLYFTSNRKGGFGGLDIYTATRSDLNSDDWTNIKNLGPDINTKYNDESPFLSQDGKVLYFSSYGHFNMGGYDVFYSSLLDNGRWSVPLNMGYPLNTTDDDTYFVPVENGNFAYVTRYYDDSFGKTDIYKVELFSDQHPRKFILRALVSLPPNLNLLNKNIQAFVINKATRDTVGRFNIDPKNSNFDTDIVAGNYQLVIQGDEIEKTVREFSIDKNQQQSEISVSADVIESLKAQTPTSAESKIKETVKPIEFKQAFFKVFDNKPIQIFLPFAVGTKVQVDILVDSAFVNRDKLELTKNNQYYKYIPVPGTNVLRFTATDVVDNSISKGEVVIVYEQLPDTLTPFELAQELERRKNEVQYLKTMLLSLIQNDSIRNCISRIDVDEANITTINDLSQYLKYQLKCYKNSPAEIDTLIIELANNQRLAIQLVSQAISTLAESKLGRIADSVANTPINSVPDYTNKLLQSVASDSVLLNDLNTIALRLALKSDVYYYLQELRKVSNGAFKQTLDNLKLNEEDITTPTELLNYLIDNMNSRGYGVNDIYASFFALPINNLSASELLTSFKNLASHNELKMFFEEQPQKQVKSVQAFGMQLYDAAKKRKIDPIEIVKLLLKVNDSIAFNNYIADIQQFSRKQFSDMIARIDFRAEQIQTPVDLWKYLKNNKFINEQQWITLNLNVASKNLLEYYQLKPRRAGHIFDPVSFAISFTLILLLIIVLVVAYRMFKENL